MLHEDLKVKCSFRIKQYFFLKAAKNFQNAIRLEISFLQRKNETCVLTKHLMLILVLFGYRQEDIFCLCL